METINKRTITWTEFEESKIHIKDRKLINGRSEGHIIIEGELQEIRVDNFPFSKRKTLEITDLIIERYNNYQELQRSLIAFKIGLAVMFVILLIILKYNFVI